MTKEENQDNFKDMFMKNSGTGRRSQNFLKKSDKFDANAAQICVNGRLFPFDMGDPIFKLSKTCHQTAYDKDLKKKKSGGKPPVDDCQVCKTRLDPKKVNQCEFCAKHGCPDCFYKNYPFPKAPITAGDKRFGLICKLCEAKFHLSGSCFDIVS